MAAKKKRRRRFGGPIARRWFAVGALVLVGLLYYRPLHDFADASSQRAVRVAAVRQLQKEHKALEQRLKRASTLAVLVQPPGRAPLHRQGHPAVATRAAWISACCASWSRTLIEPS